MVRPAGRLPWPRLWAVLLLALLPLHPSAAKCEPVYTLLFAGTSQGTARFVEDLSHLWRAGNAAQASTLTGRIVVPDQARLHALRRAQAQFAIVDADALARRRTGYPDLVAVALLWPETLHVLARGGGTAPLAALPGGDLWVASNAVYGQVALAGAPAATSPPGRWLILPGEGIADGLQRRPLPLLLASGVAPVPEIEQALRDHADLRVSSIARPLIDQVRTVSPWLASVALPGGTYPGQPQPIETMAVSQVLITRTDAPVDLVLNALAALYRWQERMAATNTRFAAIDRKSNGAAIAWFPYHAAAVKELGLTPPDRPSQ